MRFVWILGLLSVPCFASAVTSSSAYCAQGGGATDVGAWSCSANDSTYAGASFDWSVDNYPDVSVVDVYYSQWFGIQPGAFSATEISVQSNLALTLMTAGPVRPGLVGRYTASYGLLSGFPADNMSCHSTAVGDLCDIMLGQPFTLALSASAHAIGMPGDAMQFGGGVFLSEYQFFEADGVTPVVIAEYDAATIPEPASMWLAGATLLAGAGVLRKRLR